MNDGGSSTTATIETATLLQVPLELRALLAHVVREAKRLRALPQRSLRQHTLRQGIGV